MPNVTAAAQTAFRTTAQRIHHTRALGHEPRAADCLFTEPADIVDAAVSCTACLHITQAWFHGPRPIRDRIIPPG